MRPRITLKSIFVFFVTTSILSINCFGSSLIQVVGNTGAGKSTLIKFIQEEMNNVKLVEEPVDQWQKHPTHGDLLGKFLKNQKQWGLEFESYIITTWVDKLKQHQTSNTIKITDGSIYSSRYCFAKDAAKTGFLTKNEWDLYKTHFSKKTANINKPSGFIYLKASADDCISRIKIRNRKGEENYPQGPLKRILDNHNKFYVEKQGWPEHLKDVPVLILDATKNFKEDTAIRKDYLTRVKDFIKQVTKPKAGKPLSKAAQHVIRGNV